VAASLAASQGMDVTIFEERRPGGTCLNVGCIPTKTFCHAADVLLAMRNGNVFGIGTSNSVSELDFSLSALVDKKEAVVNQLVAGVEALMKAPGIRYIGEHATLKDANMVEAGGVCYEVDNIIIATGSTPAVPPFVPHPFTSTDLLSLREQPRRLCIIGAGVIGMEMASAFNAFGTEVTVVEYLGECLPPVDAEIARRLRRQLEKRGIKFYLNAEVTSVTDGGEVNFTQKGKPLAVVADKVLTATGRRPNVTGLGLERLGIACNRRGIVVDDHFETSVSGVYAIGDVCGHVMLAHAASAQGRHVVRHLLGQVDETEFMLIPSAVFTNPEVASVGCTEQQCKTEQRAFVAHKSLYRANGKALSMGETDGMAKLLTDEAGHIIGCHIMGPHAADLVQEVTVAMAVHMTLENLKNVVHIHPTLSEVLTAL